MTLFLERGYAEVTVAEIADRAGLTKRSFFNHFADKREVLFAGAQAYEANVLKHLAEAAGDLAPIDAVVAALTGGSLDLAAYGEFARARRDLIASSTELRERDLIKMTSLTAAIAGALRERGIAARAATFTAQAAVAVFTTAYDEWVDDLTADFPTLMRGALAELRRAIGA